MTSSAMSPYSDLRAHELRDRYGRVFGGEEIPVPVESIAEDLLGLRIEERLLERSGTGGVGADAGRRERQRAVRCFAECDGVALFNLGLVEEKPA